MNESAPHTTQGHLRASDVDRNMVNDVLTTAYAEGRITREELDERTNQVLAAKTFNELSPITSDLMPTGPVAVYSSPVPARREGAGLAIGGAGFGMDQGKLSAHLSTMKRSRLQVRAETSITSVMGDVKLDLVDGAMEQQHCTIDLQLCMTSVTLYVPEGVRVINNASGILGEVNLKGIPAGSLQDPSITLIGNALMSEVNVIGPEHRSWKKRLKLEG